MNGDLIRRVMDLNEKNKLLEEENEDLKSKLIDLTFEMNYNKQTELLNFFQELYLSLENVNKKLTKEDLIKNLKEYMEEFARDNKLMLK